MLSETPRTEDRPPDTLSREKFDSKTNQAPLPSGGDGGGSAGFLQTDHCIGTYIHGFLDNAPVIEYLLKDKAVSTSPIQSYAAFKEEQYDKLADHVRKHVDIKKLYQILTDD